MPQKLDRKAVEAEIAATQDEFFAARRDEYLALVQLLQRAQTRTDYMRLQIAVRDRFAGMQHGMAEIRPLLEQDKAELRRLAPMKPQSRDAVAELKRRITIREQVALRNNVLLHVLRCIADGMVWRATGYDRALFSILGDGQRVGRFPAEEGAIHERSRAQQLWDEGALPFFNDLTNCLREGDLTVLQGELPAVEIAVEEVKADGRPRPRSRQARRLDEKLAALKGAPNCASEKGRQPSISRLDLPLKHHLATAAVVLAAARRDGYAQAQPHPALTVSATDLRWAQENEEVGGDWMLRAARGLGWSACDGRHFWASALATRLRERRHPSSGYHAPLAMFPFCAEDVIDLLMGFFDLVVVLRVERLKPDFAARGIEVEFAFGRDAERTFLRATRGTATVTVPAPMREQLLRELTRIETIVAVVDALLNDIEAGAPIGRSRLVVCDERRSWSEPPRYLAA